MTKRSREEILEVASTLAAKFAERASQHDAEGSFPMENYEDLRAAGYPSLTVPVELGGWGASLCDAVQAQEALAMGDGSTALAITMHIQTIGAASGEKWGAQQFERLCAEVVERGALVNSCASEPEMGSPSRGGRPATTARRENHGADTWLINGRKTFASMSPALDYFIIPASIEGEDQVARFLVPKQPGIQIEDSWDAMGMRATGSHDLKLVDVRIADRYRISQAPVGFPDPNRPVQNAWYTLTVSAVYLGIAAAAQTAALNYAQERTPSALGKPIATLESIQRRLGESELALQVARSVLYRTAEQWDANPAGRDNMAAAIIVAKVAVTNAAIQIVDHAMRVAGGASMTRVLPLERYYRDVRAGLSHPPNDDSALATLGRVALQRAAPVRSA